MKHIQTPVLIVGGGLVGLTTALFLDHHKIPYLLIERHAGTSIHPRARGLHVRVMEIMRQIGIEEAIKKAGLPMAKNEGFLNAVTLSSVDFEQQKNNKRMDQINHLLGSDFLEHSPSKTCKCTQDEIEPVLLEAAISRGGNLRYYTELISFDDHENGITAVIKNRKTEEEEIVHAQFIIAADGAHSSIRKKLGVPMSGGGSIGHQINVFFEADLSSILKGQRFNVCNIQNKNTSGALLTVGENNRYTYHFSYHPEKGENPEDYPINRCIPIIQKAIGNDEIDIHILNISPWEAAYLVADHYRVGNIFLVGDAAHLMPPTGGYGGSTGIQDAHNLAWKLAAVINGYAGSDLLNTYEQERKPIAHFTATQAVMVANAGTLTNLLSNDKRKKNSPIPANSMLVNLAYHYDSVTVIPEEMDRYDPDQLTIDARPGKRAPHIWMNKEESHSILDEFGKEFVLLTSDENGVWEKATDQLVKQYRTPIRTLSITKSHFDTEVVNRFLEKYEITHTGAVLVRPDGFVGWRSVKLSENPKGTLSSIYKQLVCL